MITTILSLGGLSVCLSLLANVITACRLGQHGSQCDHSLPSWGYPVFAAVCAQVRGNKCEATTWQYRAILTAWSQTQAKQVCVRHGDRQSMTHCRLGGIRCLQLCVSQAKQVWGNMAVPSNLVTNTSSEARSRSRVSVFGYRLMYRAM